MAIEHDELTNLIPALVLGAVCLLCLTYLNLRTRAVEIVR